MSTTENPQEKNAVARCPLCDAPLLENPNECSKCDWVKGYRHRSIGTNPVDVTACLLSIVPGAGHFYKGHKVMPWLYLAGAVLALFWCAIAATATAGLGLLMLPLYWAWVMTHAYWIEDLNAGQRDTDKTA
jgi:hypothetical protein